VYVPERMQPYLTQASTSTYCNSPCDSMAQGIPRRPQRRRLPYVLRSEASVKKANFDKANVGKADVDEANIDEALAEVTTLENIIWRELEELEGIIGQSIVCSKKERSEHSNDDVGKLVAKRDILENMVGTLGVITDYLTALDGVPECEVSNCCLVSVLLTLHSGLNDTNGNISVKRSHLSWCNAPTTTFLNFEPLCGLMALKSCSTSTPQPVSKFSQGPVRRAFRSPIRKREKT
jgi:hypothetical protein